MTQVVNLYKDKFDIYCGRGKGVKNDPLKCSVNEYGWLGNPIALHKKCLLCGEIHTKNGDTLPCYKQYFESRLKDVDFKKSIKNLKGKTLGCFCKPKPCHCDVIKEYLDDL